MSIVTADSTVRERRTAGHLAHALLTHLGYDLRDVHAVELVPPGLLRVESWLRDESGRVIVSGDSPTSVTVEYALIWPGGDA